jgi:hypothetical protein
MASLTDELDRLTDSLDRAVQSRPEAGDAIDLVLGSDPRRTHVRSLRDDPVVEAFRRELIDGLVRVDTVNRLLDVVNTVVTALIAV